MLKSKRTNHIQQSSIIICVDVKMLIATFLSLLSDNELFLGMLVLISIKVLLQESPVFYFVMSLRQFSSIQFIGIQ